MKKLALIVLLAVIASRVLTERDVRPDRTTARPFSIVSAIFDDEPSVPPTPPRPPDRWFQAAEPTDRDEIRSFSRRDPDAKPARSVGVASRHRPRSAAPPTVLVPVGSAQQAPDWFPQSDEAEKDLAQPDDSGVVVLVGRLSISEQRARDDLRITLNRTIADWLAADVPMDWVPPKKLVDRMVLGTYVQESAPPKTAIVAGLGDGYKLYRTGQKLDFSSMRRADFLRHYHRDVASFRMKRSAGVIGVALASLALISGYIRADEATQGYYTNRLRVLALVGLGIAGVFAFRNWF